MMNIREIQELRDQLEKDLTISVRHHLNSFKEKTGLMPDTVHVEMIEMKLVGFKPENVFYRVHVSLEL